MQKEEDYGTYKYNLCPHEQFKQNLGASIHSFVVPALMLSRFVGGWFIFIPESIRVGNIIRLSCYDVNQDRNRWDHTVEVFIKGQSGSKARRYLRDNCFIIQFRAHLEFISLTRERETDHLIAVNHF